MTTDSIITEWTYRLPKGYPTSDSDYEILRSVLSEMTTLSDQAQQLIINRAKGNNTKQTTIIKEGSPDYDAAIRSRLKYTRRSTNSCSNWNIYITKRPNVT